MASWRDVFEELVRERRAGLVGYATLLAGNATDGEDLVHDAIIRSFGRARAFTHVNAAEAYVRQAISSAFIDGTRKARTARAAMPALVIRDQYAAPDTAVANTIDVHAALAQLPPRERACVVLRYYADLTVPEIAAHLNISDGAVKRYLSDGIGRLNPLLGTRETTEHATESAPRATVERRASA